ncbi:uncharacterized protein zgc:163143 [Clupea harengus]|uniref:THAP domain-containing protein 1 n=1 Tax=Clupea harengus TaxID=7950 RepID=A0A6P8FPR5_CLUHA|nr:uncharacterized protein zgc:163143 [Clupea harengus]
MTTAPAQKSYFLLLLSSVQTFSYECLEKMTLCCIAYNCRSKREKGVGFHRFPHNNPKLLKLWIAKLKWKDWTPSLNTLICSKHFEEKYLNRTGWRPRLRPGAVPTIFDFPESTGPRKANINPRSKRATADPRLLQALQDVPKWRRKRHVQQKPREFNQVAVLTQPQLQPQSELQKPQESQAQKEPHTEAGSQAQPQQEPQAQPKPRKLPPPRKSKIKRRFVKPVKPEASEETQRKAPVAKASILFPWAIQGDANMFRRRTLSSFFHSHYCLPQSFHWPGDAEANFEPLLPEKSEASTTPHVIKVTERWQWLGLDFRGPLPETMNGDRFLMTVTDYHSKWVEAFPVTSMVSPEAAGILCDLCGQFGYPLGVLSRLHRTNISKLNSMIRNRLQRQGLEYDSSFIIHHRQTAYLDPVSESLINSMVSELVKEHPENWNMYLPGVVIRLCCREHPTIGKSPFACMYIKEPRPVTTPRDLPFSPAIVEDSSFVIDLSEKPDSSREQTAGSHLTDAVVSEEVCGDGDGTSNGQEPADKEEQSN